MNVFLSWSGERSKAIGAALQDWLQTILQGVDVWMSPDIDAGAKWDAVLAEKLRKATVGILCLVPENVTNPWVMFEAGAMFGALDEPRVCPYLFDMELTELALPLGQF